jgi:LmbE family N-acetylglucosaminyl deacetylase
MPHRHERALIVVAHPDDEVLGAGIWMHRHGRFDCHILHLTDGSPRDAEDARSAGFETREAYAAARRLELRAALELIGVPGKNCYETGTVDKEAYLHLGELTEALQTVVEKVKPSVVLTSAYEGGHPDHDAAAFAVSGVRARNPDLDVLEFPLYHASARGEMVTGSFADDRPGAEVLWLTRTERQLKRRMLECFVSQAHVLRHFRVEREGFRRAAEYDFTKPPHPGELLYEQWGWGISGEVWREKAREALESDEGRTASACGGTDNGVI